MIKAKPTKYCGIQFRSRTEAKYCMLFNMFDVAWTYESRRFPLPSGSYLPDFYLPDWNTWLEIKGPQPKQSELQLCEELKLVTKANVVIAFGWPPTIWTLISGSWVRGYSFCIINTKLRISTAPGIPTKVYDEISQKIWSQRRIRSPRRKKR